MTEKEIHALITLLDDTDEEVVRHVTEKLRTIGTEAVPILEDRWQEEDSKLLQQRIEALLHDIQYGSTINELEDWARTGGEDLFEGAFLIAKYRYPDLNKQDISNQIDQIKLDAWLELKYDLSSLEKVRIINHVFYSVHGFSGNTENYHLPDNSFLNRVLETKKGNPISMAILYSIIAQRLNIPIFGVNLPQHFVLAYRDDKDLKVHNNYRRTLRSSLDFSQGGDILFYINAFNKGTVFTKANIDQFLKQLNIPPQGFYYEPCNNVDIIMRVLRNLIYSYEKFGRSAKAKDLTEVLNSLQPYSSIP